jgi:hypothetical protein
LVIGRDECWWIYNVIREEVVILGEVSASEGEVSREELVGDAFSLREKVEEVMVGSEVSTTELERFREVRDAVFGLCGSYVIGELLMGNATAREMRDTMRTMVERKLLVSDTYTLLLEGAEDIEEDACLWDVEYCRVESPQNNTDRWFSSLFEQVSRDEEQYLEARRMHKKLSEEIGTEVPRDQVLVLICDDLMRRYGVVEDKRDSVLGKVGGNGSFSRELRYVPEKRSGRIEVLSRVASHNWDSKELIFPVDLFIDVEELVDDIAIAEHELVHHFEAQGLIAEDVVVPVASAQTVLARRNSGRGVVGDTMSGK